MKSCNKLNFSDYCLSLRNLAILILIFTVFMTVSLSLFLSYDEIKFAGKICLYLISTTLILSLVDKISIKLNQGF